MAIKDAKKRNTVVQVCVRDMRVFHGSPPALHAHGHVPHLIGQLQHYMNDFIAAALSELNRYVSILPDSLRLCQSASIDSELTGTLP